MATHGHSFAYATARVDDAQAQFGARFGLWVVAAVFFLADLFCMFDHYAPWSLALWAAAMAIPIASTVLHGLWRLRLRLRPVLAVACLLLGALVFLIKPYLAYLGAPFALMLLIYLVPTGVGITLWDRILNAPAHPESLRVVGSA